MAARRSRAAFLWSYARHYPAHWVGGAIALLGTTVFGALLPWQIKLGIDALSGPRPTEAMPAIAGWLAVFALLQGAFRILSRTIIYNAGREIEFELRNDLLRHLLQLPMSFYDRTPAGQVVSRAANDTSDIRMTLGAGVIHTLNTAFQFTAAFGMMLLLSPRLTAATVFLAPVLALTFRYLSRKNYVNSKRVQEGLARLSGKVTENLNGLATVQAHGQEEREIEAFRELDDGYLQDSLRLAFFRAMTWPIAGIVAGTATVILLLYGGHLVLEGEISLGDFAAFQGYVGMLQWPMIGFGWILNVIQRGFAAIDRLQVVLDIETDVPDPEDPVSPPQELREGIEIRDLHFAFPRRGLADLAGDDEAFRPSQGFTGLTGPDPEGEPAAPTEVLRGLDLRIRPGETVALVGRIGAGKSTLCDLLVRLYPVPDGTIFLDGVDINRLTVADLRGLFGVVPQDRFLYSQTLRENLLLDQEDVSDEAMLRYARLAQLDKDVQDFPRGYDTRLGERGITLSGGQRQRACLTRALLREAPVLILDDTFSAVDTDTEEEILTALRARKGGSTTTLLITHRPSTMREADRIVVFEDGRIREQGTHDELVAAGGAYASLIAKALLREELGLDPEQGVSP